MFGSRFDNNLDLCMNGGKAPCASVCPFDLDVRAFLERLQRGRVDAAYRIYRNTVVFPDIVWRVCPGYCKNSCVRRDVDDPLRLDLLERACVEQARSTEPIAFNLPKKEHRIAIVGAGLSGMTCAMKFAPKKYDVTVYEASGALGGGLFAYMPKEVYLNEFAKQFGGETYTLLLHSPVEDLLSLDYDAVYVSSGVEARGEADHIFRCPPDLDPIGMMVDGARSLHEIEWYLKTGRRRLPGEGVEDDRPIVTPEKKKLVFSPTVPAENGESYTKEEGLTEAKRCIQCDCTACLDYCELLQKYKMYPPRLKEEVDMTMNPLTLYTGRVALRQISSCTQCGLCKQVCPVGVDVGDYFLRTRGELYEAGAFPPAFHDFWLRDMAFANGEAQLTVNPTGGQAVSQVFFPGCQIGGSDPRYVSQVYARLVSITPDTALLLRCCGAPALWAGDASAHQEEIDAVREAWLSLGKPVFILACPSCSKMLSEYLPEIECRMVYEILLETGELPLAGSNAQALGGQAAQAALTEQEAQAPGVQEAPIGWEAKVISVFDPCASRYDADTQQAVRLLAERMGYSIEELPYSKEETRCCSWGGQSFTADMNLAQSAAESRAALSDKPYVTYCTNCRDILTKAGKSCRHILDLALGINEGSREAPTATMRRQNRIALKQGLAELYGSSPAGLGDGGWQSGDMQGDTQIGAQGTVPGDAQRDVQADAQRDAQADAQRDAQADAQRDVGNAPICLTIPDELSRQMSEDLILEEDVCEVIRYCESTGKKLVDPDKGSFTGCLQRGILTYWAEYKPGEEEGGYHVIKAYSHRLMLAASED
ncbi:MAG: heterodisulfide reductase-related iron-sulfur binding cluster [Clostridiales bacterium]|nr:heterodisulfide reductase-related iron-sulfur binding cluster [Clostridiales bacterium]